MAKKKSSARRQRFVLDERHGFGHVEKTDPAAVQKQVDEDFADREDTYQGRHRKAEDDETTAGFAVLKGVAA